MSESFPSAACPVALIAALLLCACAPEAPPADGVVEAAGAWSVETLVEPGPFHGIHGLAIHPDGRILAGSVVGASTYAVDPATGAVTLFQPPPSGMADDIAVAADGTLAWTGFLTGEIWIQAPGGTPRRIAQGFPGANSLAFTADGRLFFTQVFLGDALYEADLAGVAAPREIMRDMGGLNGFEFGPDGRLYGPLWFRGSIAAVDVDAGTLEEVAAGFGIPAAVNFLANGDLIAVDTQRGQVLKVDMAGNDHDLIAVVAPAIDNLAIAPDDTVYISNMADNAIIRIDPDSGAAETLVSSPLAVASDIAASEDGRAIYVADVFSLRRVDARTGAVTELARMYADELENPLGIGVAHGRIATTSWSAGVIQLFDSASGDSLVVAHGLPAPYDALPDADGSVLFVDYLGGRLVRAAGPGLETLTELTTGLDGPVSLAADGPAHVVVAEAPGGRVLRVALADGAIEVLAEGLAGPEGVAVAADGSIVVAEVGQRRILRLGRDGAAPEVLASDLPIGFAAPPETPSAYLLTGVAVDADGNVVVSSDERAALYRLRRP